MLEYLVVGIIVGAAFLAAAYSLYRTLTGTSKAACGCGKGISAPCSVKSKNACQLTFIEGSRS